MKNLIIIISVILVGVLTFFYFTKDTKNIADLEAHFKTSGLSISNVYLPQKEKEALGAFKGFVEDLGAENNTIVDSQLKSINGIEVKITQYKNTEVAQQDYKRQVDSKLTSKKRAEKNNSPYYHTDYFLNGVFVLNVHHFDTDLSFRNTVINIPKDKLDKIITTFNKF